MPSTNAVREMPLVPHGVLGVLARVVVMVEYLHEQRSVDRLLGHECGGRARPPGADPLADLLLFRSSAFVCFVSALLTTPLLLFVPPYLFCFEDVACYFYLSSLIYVRAAATACASCWLSGVSAANKPVDHDGQRVERGGDRGAAEGARLPGSQAEYPRRRH